MENTLLRCVRGVAIGDAFGDSFFGDTLTALEHISIRAVPPSNREFTDDTVMTIAVYQELTENDGVIDQDSLIKRFIGLHDLDPNRGYGAGVRRLLREVKVCSGQWREASSTAYEGMGSMGNGAAMRVAPIGVYHYGNLDLVARCAIKSAEVTHFNEEAKAGAIAVAVAAALACRVANKEENFSANEFISKVAENLPETDVKSKILKSLHIGARFNIETIRAALGDGVQMLAQDTVPFALWCAAHHLHNFEDALWKAVSILGDRDTICAIVGGIVVMSAGESTVPIKWLDQFENPVLSPFWST